MQKLNYILPFGLLLLVVSMVAVIQYAMPRGPWVTALYLDGRDAFTAVSPHVSAIVQDTPQHHTASVYLGQPSQRQALRMSGAILLDTQGLPLCLKPSL